MSMNTKKNISIVLLIPPLLWLLRKMNVLYPRPVHGAAGLVHDHGGYHDVPGEAEKEAGRLILAFGLFCIVTAVMEIKGYFA